MTKAFQALVLMISMGFMPIAGAVNISNNGLGEAIVAPYYSVRGGWITLLNINNTSRDPILVKIRVREAYNGRSVADTVVGLAAHDSFVAVMLEDSNGNLILRSADSPNDQGQHSCNTLTRVNSGSGTLEYAMFSQQNFTAANSDGRPGSDSPSDNMSDAAKDRMREGYIEMFVLGHADSSLIQGPERFGPGDAPSAPLAGAINMARAIAQFDCANFKTALTEDINSETGDRHILDTARQFGEPTKVLRADFRMIHLERGTEVEQYPLAWANFFNPGANDSDSDGVVKPLENANCTITRGDERTLGANWSPQSSASCQNLVTAATGHANLEPSLNDAWPAVARKFDDDSESLVTINATVNSFAGRPRGIDAVSATIQARSVLGEWSQNLAAGVTTDWILTMPTRPFYVDQAANAAAAIALDSFVGHSQGRSTSCITQDYDNDGSWDVDFDGNGVSDCEAAPYPPFDQALAENEPECAVALYSFVNRAGEKIVPSEAPSPDFGTGLPEDPYKGQVHLCTAATLVSFNGASAFKTHEQNIDTSSYASDVAGWAEIDLTNKGARTQNLAGSTPGLPMIGFNIKHRVIQGASTTNYSSSVPLYFSR